MNSIVVTSTKQNIKFGYEGEDNVTKIIFPYDESWLEYGEGNFEVRILRCGDEVAYTATEVVDDRQAMTLTMTVTDIELSVRGRGEMQLCYVCPDSIKKSPIYQYTVNRSVDYKYAVDPPEGSIIASVEKSLSEIKNTTNRLSNSVISIESSIDDVNSQIDNINDKISEFDEEIDSIGEVETRVDNLETSIASINGRINTAEGNINENTESISDLNESVTELENRKVTDLETSGGRSDSGKYLTVGTDGKIKATSLTIPPTITVDASLSTTSTNPVQNKAIKTELNNINSNIATCNTEISKINGSLNVLTNELVSRNAFDILSLCDHPGGTHRGVTFTWDDDYQSCAVIGTATDGMAVRTFFNESNSFPKGMVAGGTYRLKYSSTDVVFQIYKYTNGVFDSNPLVSLRISRDIKIPDDASGVQIRLAVSNGKAVNETVSPVLLTASSTNSELDSKIEEIASASELYKANPDAVSDTLFNRLNAVKEWSKGTYIDINDGKIKPLSNPLIYKSCSMDMIPIPSGTQIHIHNAERIAKYNHDGTFSGAINPVEKDVIIPNNVASFVRIQYGSVDQTILNTYVAYRYSPVDESQSMDSKLGEIKESVEQSGITVSSQTGNPIVLNDCDPNQPFSLFDVNGAVSGEKVVICGKNIFAIRHTNGTFTKNNVNFQFNTINNTIRIFTNSGAHASADTTDGFTDFGPDFSKVNGVTFYHDFKFRFATDTIVSVSDNPNQDVPFDWGVQMRIYDGTNIINVGTGGVSFVAEAGKEYVAYFLVKGPNTTDPGNSYPGWSGDITYAPQIEISSYPTAYEKFSGLKAVLNYAGEENIFTCGGVGPGRYTTQNGAIMALYDSAENAVYLNAHNDSNNNVIIYDTSKDGKVNGQDFYYVSKFMVGRIAESLTDYVANGGKLTIGKNDLESGQWSYSTKTANTARARSANLIPVTAGTVVSYVNTTFDTYFGVLETPSSSDYIQGIGWKTDGNGSFVVAQDGYMTFIIRNHADTTATVDVNDYDSTVIVQPQDMPVFVSTFDNRFAKKVFAQLYDKGTIRTDYNGQGFFINCEIGTEYALRYGVRANADVNCVIKPVISTGIYALKARCTSDTAVIYSDGSASFTVRRREISTKAKSARNMDITNAVMALTGGHILTPFSKLTARGPMVSFIDDDTSNYQYVKYYHDIFASKNALGGYAVETMNLDNGVSDGLPELLLDYEEEGFACLYHCYHQADNETRYWINGHPSYSPSLINENFMRGLRSIREYGFSNYKYWVTPYGVNDKFIVDLAKNHGMQCLLNCPSRLAQEGFVSPYGNVSRWNIPRVIFGNYRTNDVWLHRAIQGAKAANGWVIIVSHVNSWGWGPADQSGQRTENDAVLNMKTRLENLIQYCIDEGLEIVPFPVAFEEYRASFLLNELF